MWVYTAVAGGNFLIFSLAVGPFINDIHHHWIVPGFSGLLAAEAGLFRALGERGRPWLRALWPWLALVALILQWRQLSMFQCFRHCEGRLALGLLFLALGGWLAAAGPQAPGPKKAAALFWRAAALWLAVILAISFYRGTFTLN